MKLANISGLALSVTFAMAAVLGSAGDAKAHPDVDEGVARYQRADFPGALEAFARAEAADDLTRGELLELLERRILIHLVQGNPAAADRDLESLHAIDPDHTLAPDIPPEVAEAFRALENERLSVVVDSQPSADETRLITRVEGDPHGLVREVRLGYRVDDGPWQTSSERSVRVPTSSGSTVELHAEAVGPGGAVLAAVASADAPRRIRVSGGDAEGRGTSSAGGGFPWLWVGIGAAALIAIGAVIAIAVVASGDGAATNTQPMYPMIEF